MSTSVAEPTYPSGVQLTVFDERFREDPYPALAETREKAPIHFADDMKSWVKDHVTKPI